MFFRGGSGRAPYLVTVEPVLSGHPQGMAGWPPNAGYTE